MSTTENNCTCKENHVYKSEEDVSTVLKNYMWNNMTALQTNIRYLRLKADQLNSLEHFFKDSNDSKWLTEVENWNTYLQERMIRIKQFEQE